MAGCGGGGGGGCGCARVFPRPSVTISGVGTSESARTRVGVGSRSGAIFGGSITQKSGAAETMVTIALWRTAAQADGDFIDRFQVDVETTGPEAGQGSYSFYVPAEFINTSDQAFWFTIQNSTQSGVDWVLHFDVAEF